MKIAIYPIAYDVTGDVTIDVDIKSEFEVYRRRSTKTPTLDGLSAITDMGYAPSDSIFNISVYNLSKTDRDTLIRLVKTYSILKLACRDGVFEGQLNTLNLYNSPATMIFSVTEKLT